MCLPCADALRASVRVTVLDTNALDWYGTYILAAAFVAGIMLAIGLVAYPAVACNTWTRRTVMMVACAPSAGVLAYAYPLYYSAQAQGDTGESGRRSRSPRRQRRQDIPPPWGVGLSEMDAASHVRRRLVHFYENSPCEYRVMGIPPSRRWLLLFLVGLLLPLLLSAVGLSKKA